MSSEVEICSPKGPRVSLDGWSTSPTLRYHYGVRRLTRELCIRTSSSLESPRLCRIVCAGTWDSGLSRLLQKSQPCQRTHDSARDDNHDYKHSLAFHP